MCRLGTFKGMRHLFDGYGMLVKLHIDNGKVHVQQRCAQSSSPCPILLLLEEMACI